MSYSTIFIAKKKREINNNDGLVDFRLALVAVLKLLGLVHYIFMRDLKALFLLRATHARTEIKICSFWIRLFV